MQLHVNTGHPSNDSLARAIRATGGSQRSIDISDHCLTYRGGSDWTGTSTTPLKWTCSPWPTTLATSWSTSTWSSWPQVLRCAALSHQGTH
eukprot:6839081-Pyramimonas_sp.AAC.1